MVELKDKIVLIGMPGCGKSTFGKIIAKKLEYNFYDMDKYIENISGKSIPELFEEGEEVFRQWETKSCKELVLKKRAIISSGGGVVKKHENIEIFNKGCIILFIDRPVEEIAKDVNLNTRPLLKDGTSKLYELYDERYALYKASAHITVQNIGSIEDVVEDVKDMLKGAILR